MHLGVNIEQAQYRARQPLTTVRGVPLERLKELGVANRTARFDFVNLIKISICSLPSASTIGFHASAFIMGNVSSILNIFLILMVSIRS